MNFEGILAIDPNPFPTYDPFLLIINIGIGRGLTTTPINMITHPLNLGSFALIVVRNLRLINAENKRRIT